MRATILLVTVFVLLLAEGPCSFFSVARDLELRGLDAQVPGYFSGGTRPLSRLGNRRCGAMVTLITMAFDQHGPLAPVGAKPYWY